MRGSKIISSLAVIAAVILLGGCSISIGKSSSGGLAGSPGGGGGIWKSTDSGKTWTQKIAFPIANGTSTIAGVNIRRISFDPQDHNAIYLSTQDNGIVYSYDGGDSWKQFSQLKQGTVREVAVSPSNKCLLYAVISNVLESSDDCGRTWHALYTHSDAKTLLTDVMIDSHNSDIIYVATNYGEVFKSLDGGRTWAITFSKENVNIVDLVPDKSDSRIIYLATSDNGIYKTVDGGGIWLYLGDGLRAYGSSQEYKKLLTEPTAGGLILFSKFGMLRSTDGGLVWAVVNLLSSPESVNIYSAAVNPQNSNEIYYATINAFLKTTDLGETWSSAKLPSSRLPSALAVDPSDPSTLYLGTFAAN